MLMVFVNDIHSRPPGLNSNLEETLDIILSLPLKRQKKQVFHALPITRKVDITFLVMVIVAAIHLYALHMINISVVVSGHEYH